jgi:Zn-dependent protease with chaperone function
MTFVVRCLGVSLAFFLISYCALSLAVSRSWRLVKRLAMRLSACHLADVLFALRVLPAVVAMVMCCAFVIPSFLLLEPRVSAEPVGEVPLALGIACLALIVAGVYNALAAYRRTSRTVEAWLTDATELPSRGAVSIFRIRPAVPALTLTGLCAHRVLLSEAAAALLATGELETALKHEVAHVRRRDNLKKLLFRLCAFPGMASLEAAWSGSEEMAADDLAVSCTSEALDLASALIKLSRLAPLHPTASLTTALLQDSPSSVNARVERLVAWDDSRSGGARSSTHWYVRSALVGTALSVLLTYGVALREMHTLTEWLVR